MALQEGSGHFFVNTSVKGIADVVFQETQGTAQVRGNIWTDLRDLRDGLKSTGVQNCTRNVISVILLIYIQFNF